jgi:hypothetical protein
VSIPFGTNLSQPPFFSHQAGGHADHDSIHVPNAFAPNAALCQVPEISRRMAGGGGLLIGGGGKFRPCAVVASCSEFLGCFPLIHGVRQTFSTSKNVVVNDISNLLTLSGLGKALTLTEGIEPRQVRL